MIAVKHRPANRELAKLHHLDVWGTRESKYDFLAAQTLASGRLTTLAPQAPFYFFKPLNNDNNQEYERGFGVDEIFKSSSTGIQTSRDMIVVGMHKTELARRIEIFSDAAKSDQEIRSLFFGEKKVADYLPGDTRGWNLSVARKTIADFEHINHIKNYTYRPLDSRYLYYVDHMID